MGSCAPWSVKTDAKYEGKSSRAFDVSHLIVSGSSSLKVNKNKLISGRASRDNS